MLNTNLPEKITKFKKNRIFKQFNIFFTFQKFPHLISLQNYKLFYGHLKMINFLVSKKINIVKKLTKKEKYKKTVDHSLKKLFFIKNNFIKNFNKIPEKNDIFIKKYKIITKIILIFQLPKISYTRKSQGLRMGKGKGSVYSWFFNINAGWRLIYFLNWNNFLIKYFLNIFKKLLPGKNNMII